MADHRRSNRGLIRYVLLMAAGLWLAYVLLMAFALRDGLAPGVEEPGIAAVVAALTDIWPMFLPSVILAAIGFWVVRSGRRRDGSA